MAAGTKACLPCLGIRVAEEIRGTPRFIRFPDAAVEQLPVDSQALSLPRISDDHGRYDQPAQAHRVHHQHDVSDGSLPPIPPPSGHGDVRPRSPISARLAGQRPRHSRRDLAVGTDHPVAGDQHRHRIDWPMAPADGARGMTVRPIEPWRRRHSLPACGRRQILRSALPYLESGTGWPRRCRRMRLDCPTSHPDIAPARAAVRIVMKRRLIARHDVGRREHAPQPFDPSNLAPGNLAPGAPIKGPRVHAPSPASSLASSKAIWQMPRGVEAMKSRPNRLSA